MRYGLRGIGQARRASFSLSERAISTEKRKLSITFLVSRTIVQSGVEIIDRKKIALVTGANKGIGLEIAKELGKLGMVVLVGARDEERGQEAVRQLTGMDLEAVFVQLEVTDEESVKQAAAQIDRTYGRLDVLVNNAGITGTEGGAPSEISVESMRAVYETNVFGVVAVTNALMPLLRKSPAARIVNVSSGLGSITHSSDPNSELAQYNFMSYQSSKSALNAITVAYAKEFRTTGIKVNAADPGYTATDLNQHRGHRTTEQAAVVIVRLATLPEDGPSGTFQDENGELPW